MKLFAPHQLDFYKISHPEQYPDGTEYVYSNFTPRSGKLSNIPDNDGVIFIGLQLFCKTVLIDLWNDTFFNKPKEVVLDKYRRRISSALNTNIDISRLEALHDLGYLPIKIKALPEGRKVPYGVPCLTIVNTHRDFYWVTNMLESVLSAELWHIITSATTYRAYHNEFDKYAKITGADRNFIPFQSHDFSYRGLTSMETAAKSSFACIAAGAKGTDSVPGIDIAIDYYNAKEGDFIAGSIPATEHSVMCAGEQSNELDTFKRLITDIYPDGFISIVSDTWDFWGVIKHILPELRDTIESRDGRVIIRPDSGDPVKIICGDDNAQEGSHEYKGLIECLWDIFGGTVNSKGFKVLNGKIGAIYGESITFDRQHRILRGLADKGFASSNIVLGVGSYAYQYVTRDTHGFAMKATSVVINGERKDIFKDPKTDNEGSKKSAKGLLMVIETDGNYSLKDGCTEHEEARGALETVFLEGKLMKEYSLSDVLSNVELNG